MSDFIAFVKVLAPWQKALVALFVLLFLVLSVAAAVQSARRSFRFVRLLLFGTAMGESPDRINRLRVVTVSSGLYLAALALPCLWLSTGKADLGYPGYMCLLIGPLAVFEWDFAWFANPLHLLASRLFLAGKDEAAGRLGFYALVLASNTLIHFWSGNVVVGDNCCGPLDTLGVGFYCWVASLLVVFVASLIFARRAKGQAGAAPDP
jgi:hypothetical protein